MDQNEINDIETKIEAEKSSKFWGRARIPLEYLYFPVHDPRDLDRSNVNRLKGTFLREGIKRQRHENHIPATISKEDLQLVIQNSGISPETLHNAHDKLPLLAFSSNQRVQCLHGKHRIEAARDSPRLCKNDRWWTVTLYSEGRIHGS